MANLTKLTPKKRTVFLDTLAETGNVSQAAHACGLSRAALYERRANDPEFRQEWQKAMELGVGALEDEALRRAVEGVSQAIYHQGLQFGTARAYSDILMMFLLKAHRPEIYRDRPLTAPRSAP